MCEKITLDSDEEAQYLGTIHIRLGKATISQNMTTVSKLARHVSIFWNCSFSLSEQAQLDLDTIELVCSTLPLKLNLRLDHGVVCGSWFSSWAARAYVLPSHSTSNSVPLSATCPVLHNSTYMVGLSASFALINSLSVVLLVSLDPSAPPSWC